MMRDSLIDRVVAAKQAVSSQLPHGASLSEVQQAEILIAQVQAIISGDDDLETEPEPTAEKTDGAA